MAASIIQVQTRPGGGTRRLSVTVEELLENRRVKRPVDAFKFDICDFSHNADKQKGRGHRKRQINHRVLLLYVFITSLRSDSGVRTAPNFSL